MGFPFVSALGNCNRLLNSRYRERGKKLAVILSPGKAFSFKCNIFKFLTGMIPIFIMFQRQVQKTSGTAIYSCVVKGIFFLTGRIPAFECWMFCFSAF